MDYDQTDTPADRLRRARYSAGFDGPTEAAGRFGWNRNTYKSHENAARGINRKNASKYAAAYGTTAAWILFGEGEPPAPRNVSPLSTNRVNPEVAIPPQTRQEVGKYESEIDPHRALPVFPPTSREKRIDVIGVGIAGEGNGDFELNGEVVDRVESPPSLLNAKGVFALYVIGESMSPRFKPGDLIFVHPNKPVLKGDDVLVELHGSVEPLTGPALIKEFVRKNDEFIVLKQYHPPKEFRIAVRLIKRIYKIVPLKELYGT